MANSTVDMMLGGLESDKESSPLETSVIIPNSVLNTLLIPICIAGNVLVLAGIWRNPSLPTPSFCSAVLLFLILLLGFLLFHLTLPLPLHRFLGSVLSRVCHKQESSSLFNSAVFPLKQWQQLASTDIWPSVITCDIRTWWPLHVQPV